MAMARRMRLRFRPPLVQAPFDDSAAVALREERLAVIGNQRRRRNLRLGAGW